MGGDDFLSALGSLTNALFLIASVYIYIALLRQINRRDRELLATNPGFGVAEVLELVNQVRNQTHVPIILFSYFNPLLQFGCERLAAEAARAGVDGVLVTDLIPEEADEFGVTLRSKDLDLIFLVAPTSTDERLRLVAERAGGFIYAVSRAGVTGAREEMSAEAEKLVGRVRQFSDLPVAVGFGISKAEHVRDVWRYADAAVVGSAIVKIIEESESSAAAVKRVATFSQELLGGRFDEPRSGGQR